MNPNAATASTAAKNELTQLVEKHDLLPLWEHFHAVATREPRPIDRPHQWRWKDLLPLIDRAAREVPMEHAERRALVLANPAFEGKLITTGGLNGAMQILGPGESAEAHRHTAAAIRLVIESNGAETLVNGHRCEMRPGDLILTPAWTWHGHVNNSSSRAVWLDGLDVPLVRFDLDSFFFEPGKGAAPANASASRALEDAWSESGLSGETSHVDHFAEAYSPKFHYPWAATERMLAALPAAKDGSTWMRYVNPMNGQSVMPTIDCYALGLTKASATRARRATFNCICMVVEGEGSSTIGERRIDWAKNDVFTIPHWHWATHTASTSNARLFFMTDRELYARLALLREEHQ